MLLLQESEENGEIERKEAWVLFSQLSMTSESKIVVSHNEILVIILESVLSVLRILFIISCLLLNKYK